MLSRVTLIRCRPLVSAAPPRLCRRVASGPKEQSTEHERHQDRTATSNAFELLGGQNSFHEDSQSEETAAEDEEG